MAWRMVVAGGDGRFEEVGMERTLNLPRRILWTNRESRIMRERSRLRLH